MSIIPPRSRCSVSTCELNFQLMFLLIIRSSVRSFSRYDEAPKCAYGSSQLDFAIHVRLGDRAKLMPGDHSDYIGLLEAFMEAVTERVVNKTHTAPVFHVFSETSQPCPSQENGTFEEFPFWQVVLDQVGRNCG